VNDDAARIFYPFFSSWKLKVMSVAKPVAISFQAKSFLSPPENNDIRRIKSFHPSQIKFGREAPVLMFIGDEQKSLALVQDILFYHQDIPFVNYVYSQDQTLDNLPLLAQHKIDSRDEVLEYIVKRQRFLSH
jgi:hypothetical protein